jgi:hypothetical protein
MDQSCFPSLPDGFQLAGLKRNPGMGGHDPPFDFCALACGAPCRARYSI